MYVNLYNAEIKVSVWTAIFHITGQGHMYSQTVTGGSSSGPPVRPSHTHSTIQFS